MSYSKEELVELVDVRNDPTWNAQRAIFDVKPSDAYLKRVDGKAPKILTEDLLSRAYQVMCEGGTLNEVCAILGITRQTLMRWVAKDGIIFDHLRDTIATGMIQCMAWWDRKGRVGMEGTNARYFKDHLYALHMMNKFGWLSGKSASEKRIKEEVTHVNTVKVSVPDLREIQKLIHIEEKVIEHE